MSSLTPTGLLFAVLDSLCREGRSWGEQQGVEQAGRAVLSTELWLWLLRDAALTWNWRQFGSGCSEAASADVLAVCYSKGNISAGESSFNHLRAFWIS